MKWAAHKCGVLRGVWYRVMAGERVTVATRELFKAFVREGSPEVRDRHAKAVRKANKGGKNFRGGNGQEPTAVAKIAAMVLEPLGFAAEFVICTDGHGTAHTPPANYKVDFGSPIAMIAIELDGPSHLGRTREARDRKKDEVLQSLGWRIIRVKHK